MSISNNRFDLVRLVCASLVFFYHAIVLSASQPPGPYEAVLAQAAELSIQAFFIVSGALVYGSFERSKTVLDYAEKRVRRLYPAYATVILVPALIAAVLSIGNLGALTDVARYVGANLIFLNFLEPRLPGLFEGQRFVQVNGALWTLKIEVMFYLAVPLLAWVLAKLKSYWWLGIAVMVLSAFAYRDFILAADHPLSAQLARQLPGQMMYFAAGMALWRLWESLRAQAPTLFAIGLVALTLSYTVPALEALRVLGLTGLVAGIAFGPGPELNAARWGDVSYGVYIVHFPIVQSLVALGVFQALGLAGGLVVSTVLVFALSFVLWWWVEKPALRKDSHYRQASERKETS